MYDGGRKNIKLFMHVRDQKVHIGNKYCCFIRFLCSWDLNEDVRFLFSNLTTYSVSYCLTKLSLSQAFRIKWKTKRVNYCYSWIFVETHYFLCGMFPKLKHFSLNVSLKSSKVSKMMFVYVCFRKLQHCLKESQYKPLVDKLKKNGNGK